MVGIVPKWYDRRMKAAMIELTEQQVEVLGHAETMPPGVVNLRTKETFVLLRVDEYVRLNEGEYDDSPWTREELQALAWGVADRTGWEQYNDCRTSRTAHQGSKTGT